MLKIGVCVYVYVWVEGGGGGLWGGVGVGIEESRGHPDGGGFAITSRTAICNESTDKLEL